MSERRIKSVLIENFKAIRKLEFKPGMATVISGKNGLGKTSVKDAFSAMFQGGHDPDNLLDPQRLPVPPYPESCRKWARPKSGHVVLEFDNGDTAKLTVTLKGTTRTLHSAEGMRIGGTEAVKSLATGMDFEPALFVEPTGSKAKQKEERLKHLLKAMPIEFTTEQLREALDHRAPVRPMDLDEFNALLAGLEDKRTIVNRDGKKLDGSIAELEKALPEDAGEDWAEAHSGLMEQISKREQLIAGLGGDRDAWVETEKTKVRERDAEKIAELREQIAVLESAREQSLSMVETEGQRLYDEAVAEHREAIAELREKSATAKQKADESARSQFVTQQLKEKREEAGQLQVESDDLTRCIDKMRGLKKSILDDLPIAGVDVRDGEIYVNNTPWPHVNLSERYLVAAQVSALNRGELPFRVHDNADHFDKERMEGLVQGYKEAGFQVVFASVTQDKELTVQDPTEAPEATPAE
jgi:hypothetical protein